MGRRRSLPSSAAVGVTILLCAHVGWVRADDPIDLDLNPVTGLIEAVAVSTSDGDRLRHIEDPGEGGTVVDTVVSASPAANSRIAISASGESWVVWQDEATGEIRYSFRDSTTRAWSQEITLSLPGERSSRPTLVHNGNETWVAYEIGVGPGRSVAATGIEDSPEPFPPRTIVATTTSSCSLDLRLHAEAGQVWLTWRDGSQGVTWSEYDHVLRHWTSPRIELLGLSNVANALAAIRVEALAP